MSDSVKPRDIERVYVLSREVYLNLLAMKHAAERRSRSEFVDGLRDLSDHFGGDRRKLRWVPEIISQKSSTIVDCTRSSLHAAILGYGYETSRAIRAPLKLIEAVMREVCSFDFPEWGHVEAQLAVERKQTLLKLSLDREEPTSPDRPIGVSLLDVAMLLNDGNHDAAIQTRKRWQNAYGGQITKQAAGSGGRRDFTAPR